MSESEGRSSAGSGGAAQAGRGLGAALAAERGTTERLEVLQRVTELVSRTGAVDQIYPEILAEMERALHADRSAILLFDPDGVLRFKAWRGLSGRYRDQVEGHSPWSREEPSPQPVLIADVESDGGLGSLRPAVMNEGIRALAFIPLVARGLLLGKFMIYYNAPHPFSDADCSMALTVANLVAFVTERKQAEQALVESEAKLRAYLESATQSVVVADAEGRIELVNAQTEEMFGYGRDELIGRQIEILLPERYRAAHIRHRAEYFAGPRARPMGLGMYLAGQRKDGSEFPVEIALSYIQAGDDVLALSVITDVTERKRAEQALRESEEQLRVALEAGRMGTWEWDIRTGQVAWSANLEQMHGLAPGAFAGTYDAVKALIHPDDRDGFEQAVRNAVENRTPYDLEFRNLWSDGSVHWVLAKGQVFYDRTGQPARTLGVCIDITERKTIEERLRHTQKLESLGVLAGGIAHDFNNLLTGILGNASLATDDLAPYHPARARIQELILAGERAADLTRQLLAYSGKGRFIVQPIDISELVREISNLVQTSIPNKKVQVRLELAGDLPLVQADAAQIQQLVMNLIINAAEAIGDNIGMVMVTAGVQHVDEPYIRSVLAGEEIAPGEYVYLEVHDTGCGMDADTLARIFDPFFTTKFTGRGLGLAAALGIVRGHKGALKVYSEPGKGSTFKVLFPATAKRDAVREAARREADLRGTGTILVVDDEEVVRRTAKATLDRFGYAVLTAENGHSAVEIFRQQPAAISLVLLDMTMPLMSGEETLRQLRSIRPDVPIIVSSGYNQVEAIQRFAGKGTAGFIQKPYTAAQLAEGVKAVLAARQ